MSAVSPSAVCSDPSRGMRPRGCRAPARRVLGRRVRYHIGCEPGQINGRRWRSPAR
ncbi:tryptophan biosynthesis modulator TrpM [Streptomyces sp. SBT349]|uniref:tryptophan biosynthesis modulator TrpM n=1 Tax=Streptomyces sp. SBT349 TaxID=1580539 RepID=UPI003B632BBC